MGGNLWFIGATSTPPCWPPSEASGRGRESPGVILPFPGGVAASGSKAGSRYKFAIASTYAEYCPTLRDKLGDKSQAAGGRRLGQEIIINGRDLRRSPRATQAAIAAAVDTPGLRQDLGGQLRRPAGQELHLSASPAATCRQRLRHWRAESLRDSLQKSRAEGYAPATDELLSFPRHALDPGCRLSQDLSRPDGPWPG